MKKIGILFAVIAAMVAGNTASANELAAEMIQAHMRATIAMSKNVINWPIGEAAEYDMLIFGMPLGQMKKSVAREEGNLVWVSSEMTGMMAQKQEVLLDRGTGQCIKMMNNGQEAACPTGEDMEIVAQDEQSVTVPAGTFDTIHITAKVTAQGQTQEMEIWMNPRDIVMEGMAKMKINGQMPVEVVLKSMTRP